MKHQKTEAERLLAEAAELRLKASQLATTADLLIGQALELSAMAAALSEGAHRLEEQKDAKY